jgi:hypothetical protein
LLCFLFAMILVSEKASIDGCSAPENRLHVDFSIVGN